ncbi:YdbH domain-containing protein [Pelagicoccus sp. SDUM812003]|uniref:intermembrane phospholipid transport protein YdbH family protein n=1 Tax=Pelagicoccus sp. SDUM812003 TaxID=3041267 RepID=UPI00280D0625|nr:YdbH domain-containing protein [Pelagicoccus sp. SDUM812003]MDQ8202830.1 YdbH domain-containing protein [Pelagicoccus sp. SDUM812003]
MKRLPAIAKKAGLSLAAFAIALLLALLGAWIFRAPIASSLAQRELAKLGFESVELTVDELSLETTQASGISLATQFGEAQIESLRINYTIDGLWEAGKIDGLTIEGLRARVHIPESDGDEESDLELSPDNLHSFLQSLPLQQIPLDALSISNASLTVVSAFGVEEISFDAKANRTPEQGLRFDLQLADATDALTLDGVLDNDGKLQIGAQFQLSDPSATLDRLLPDWRSRLPDTSIHTLGQTNGKFGLRFSDAKQIESTATLEIADLDFSYDDLTATLPKLKISVHSDDLNSFEAQLETTPQRLEWDTFALVPNTPLSLKLWSEDSTSVSVESIQPIAWRYDQDTAQGIFTLEANLQLDDEASPQLSGAARFETSSVSGYAIAPFSTRFSGDFSQIAFTSDPIRFRSSSDAVLEAGTGSIGIPEDDELPIDFRFQSILHAKGLEGFPVALSVAPLELSLGSSIGDRESTYLLTLKNSDAAQLFASAEGASAEGDLQIIIDATEDAIAETYRGTATFSVSNLSTQFESLRGEGLSLQGEVAFSDITTELLETTPGPASFERIASKLTAKIDWQASQIESASARAQWSGGSLQFANEESGDYSLEIALSCGILNIDTLRLDQLYLNQTHRGTVDGISGSSTASAMLDGVPLSLLIEHHLAQPLSDAQLTGSYHLEPATFAHSDLLSRFAPQAMGASFSAAISAEGAFRASAAEADASLSLKLSDGSFNHPPSQLSASGIEGRVLLESLTRLDGGDLQSSLRIDALQAGDLRSSGAAVDFIVRDGTHLDIRLAQLQLFSGAARLDPLQLPLDGSDFAGSIQLERISLGELSRYADLFDGEMEGNVNGRLPFRLRDGQFEPQRGHLQLPSGETATLSYHAEGLLTDSDPNAPKQKPSLSDRVLKFLNIEPERIVERSLSNVTIDQFDAQLFPEDDPDTPLRVQLSGSARTEEMTLPVVISVRVHGTMSELYNFLIRLNSL